MATTKGNLVTHKRSVHDGVGHPCEQCDYMATTKGDLARHKRAVHEGVKYPCRQHEHMANSKGNLDQKSSSRRGEVPL